MSPSTRVIRPTNNAAARNLVIGGVATVVILGGLLVLDIAPEGDSVLVTFAVAGFLLTTIGVTGWITGTRR